MSMSMESMEWGRELEGGAVGVVVDVGVGDLTEVVPVTRAGLLAPAATARLRELAVNLELSTNICWGHNVDCVNRLIASSCPIRQ